MFKAIYLLLSLLGTTTIFTRSTFPALDIKLVTKKSADFVSWVSRCSTQNA
jgi:hypothetical protein